MDSGLTCSVYRAKGYEHCSLGGISEVANEVLLILPEGGPFTREDAERLGYPVVKLVKRDLGGKYGKYLNVEPEGDGCWAAGGRWR